MLQAILVGLLTTAPILPAELGSTLVVLGSAALLASAALRR